MFGYFLETKVIKDLIGVTKKGIKHVTFSDSYNHCDEI